MESSTAEKGTQKILVGCDNQILSALKDGSLREGIGDTPRKLVAGQVKRTRIVIVDLNVLESPEPPGW